MQPAILRRNRRAPRIGRTVARFARTRLLYLLVAFTPAIASAQVMARTVWQGVYTEAQAERGMKSFDQSCSRCHALTAGDKQSLAGAAFWKSFSQKTVGELLEYISANMPNGAPRSLSPATYDDIAAAMLKASGLPAGSAELALDRSADVRIVPQDGGTALPANALARIVGCLKRKDAEWEVTEATDPERAERVRPADEDASRPLGKRTIALKFVLTKLDSLVGSRVVVTGLLIGADGVEGVNVTTVKRIGEKCP